MTIDVQEHVDLPAGTRRRRRRGPRHPLLLTTAVIVVVLLAAMGWVGMRGQQASGELRDAAGRIGVLRQQLLAGDIAAARLTLVDLQRAARAADRRTGDPIWRAASLLPWLGDDLAAARAIAVTVRDLSDNGLPQLLEAADALTGGRLTPAAGSIDIGVLRYVDEALANGSTVVERSRQRVAGIRTGGLTGQVREAVTRLDGGLAKVSAALQPAVRAAHVLPAMLGADGPRRYLVLFQNPAEVRATGGMPGAYAVIDANQGAVEIVGQGTASALGQFPGPVLPLDPDAESLYTKRLGMFPADINLTPDFPTVARLAREMYRQRSGQTVDGVLATDPVAMSYLFKATGPVPLPGGGSLTADNAVRTLLSEVYSGALSAPQQDAFFATAARATFDALTRRSGDPRALAAQLRKATGERRVLFWSANADEQKVLSGSPLSGLLPAEDRGRPTVGVFLNDGSGAKLGYYLTQRADVTTGDCTRDGRRELRVRLTLASTAPTSGLSRSVTGLARSGDPYTVRTNVLVFSPTGGAVADARLDGAEAPVGTGFENGRQVAVVTVDLPPGAQKTLAVTLITGQLPTVDTPVTPALVTTPMVAPWRSTVAPGRPCQK